jgi:glutamate--cysteine ligase
MVPHLVTALTGSIGELEQRILDSMPAIERWFRLEWMEHTPPFYCAVDVRNAGYKLAPTDTDLFPSNWHLLTPAMLPLAVQAAMAAIEKICPEARNLLIVPQSRNTNPAYWSNIAQLQRIFHAAGLHVRIGSISPDVKEHTTIALPDGESLQLEPALRTNGCLLLQDFDPCTILLNNPLRTGVPGILEELHTQFVLPPLHAAWVTRRKNVHARCLEEITRRFGKLIGVDHWLLAPLFDHRPQVDFSNTSDRDALAEQVDALLTKIRRKHKEYGIKEKPFVVLKADDDNPALGAMLIREGKEVHNLYINAAIPATCDIFLQEGIAAAESMDGAKSTDNPEKKPVVYMIDRYVVGGFYHAGADDAPLAFAKPGASVPNRFYMYGVMGRLAMLAASYELEATDPNAEHYD